MKLHFKGYTIIELIISLCLLSILMAYGLPNYYDFKQNQIMRQEVNRLVSTINYARNQSIMTSQHIVLCATENRTACDGNGHWHTGWMVFTDKNRDREINEQDELLTYEDGMNHQITAISSRYRQIIRFDPMGSAPGTNLTIRFCDDRGADFGKSVIISNVGRPRVLQTVDRCE